VLRDFNNPIKQLPLNLINRLIRLYNQSGNLIIVRNPLLYFPNSCSKQTQQTQKEDNTYKYKNCSHHILGWRRTLPMTLTQGALAQFFNLITLRILIASILSLSKASVDFPASNRILASINLFLGDVHYFGCWISFQDSHLDR